MTVSNLPFFVYGTLRNGCGNYEWSLQGRTVSEADATLTGGILLDNQGMFPYGVLTGTDTDIVIGEVMTIADEDYDDVLRTLDRLEGYVEGRERNHYNRVTVTVTLADGTQVDANTYVVAPEFAAGASDRLPRIASGDWKTHEQTRRNRAYA